MNDKLKISPKSPKGEDGHSTFSIRVKNELLDQINVLSAQTGRSRNELINLLLDYAVNNCEISSDYKD